MFIVLILKNLKWEELYDIKKANVSNVLYRAVYSLSEFEPVTSRSQVDVIPQRFLPHKILDTVDTQHDTWLRFSLQLRAIRNFHKIHP